TLIGSPAAQPPKPSLRGGIPASGGGDPSAAREDARAPSEPGVRASSEAEPLGSSSLSSSPSEGERVRSSPAARKRAQELGVDGGTLVREDGVHVGIAVAVEDGLLVPVVRDADRKDLAALAKERERLEQHAHAGKLTAEELTGGVFSVSNLGTMGVDRFTAIVNPPEAAILAVGRVSDRVIAQAGQAVVRPVATLTLSVDHQV